MAKISLSKLRHSYFDNPKSPEDYALKEIDLEWSDGGAYALLGPSGCGKSTLLNIISGLLTPSEGSVLFDQQDVTALTPDKRNIAQVFQFPVIYDTMTVFDNLAFPLRNRHVDEATVRKRVTEIAAMLEIEDMLRLRASGLSPDNKQKLSMGRGLVRDDVNVVMFDEPLTVIDPHLKWKLRSKLKELHQQLKLTMIYVTHDQTEALTFADKVIVMNDGEVVQIGTPVDLFNRPTHTFVGHFIGSPGMNILPCEMRGKQACFQDMPVKLEGPINAEIKGTAEIGIRPEFVSLGKKGIPAKVRTVADVGRHIVVHAEVKDVTVAAIIAEDVPSVGDDVHLVFESAQTRLYRDGWLATELPKSGTRAGKRTGTATRKAAAK
ncbi:MAG: ABC transporter ATP-binding protein [SAR116 cluster bacterium]|nr:ABC transporter ATP-binding protein [SAR116 cluster bacterium]HCP17999.1 ABC transporter ATP-binding protein [Alphaproteobacteria bacterium]